MKYTLFLSALMFCFLSCSSDAVEQAPVVLSGTIQNAKAELVTISRDTNEYDLMIDEEGNFTDTLELDQGYYTFTHGRERTTIYLTPGNELSVSLDAKEFDESIKWEGTGANENNYLAQKYLLDESFGGSYKDLYSKSEVDFIAEMESRKTRLDSLLATSEISSDFAKVETDNIKYQFISDSYDFEGTHRYFAADPDFEVSDDFNNQFTSIDFGSDELYKTVPSYKDLMMYKYAYTRDLHGSMKELQTVQSQKIKDDMVALVVSYMGPGVDSLESVINSMKAITSDQALQAKLDEKYEKMKVLQPGNDSPGFDFENVNGENVKLADLQGRNVYIDVWATWCGPCKREIPFLKTLESDYHNKNIEFVSISVDTPKDKQKWLDMVRDEELKGIQLISDNGWKTSFVENYLINGIPRFILLDADGNIVSADAPRPSSGKEIREMIDGLQIL
ncbi:MAG: TlpA family protein disulfide reductase [Saprospiraceae bacterium]|nr:TlpA family protein disulfide reductase [Saprospiraceae bacterium]